VEALLVDTQHVERPLRTVQPSMHYLGVGMENELSESQADYESPARYRKYPHLDIVGSACKL